MIVLPILIAVSAASSPSSPASYLNSEAYGWGSNGTYNVSVLLFNNFGSPVSGVAVTFQTGQLNRTGYTDSQGFANLTMNGITDQELGITSPDQVGRNMTFSYEYSSSVGPITANLPIYQNQTNPYYTNESQSQFYLLPSRYSFWSMGVRNNPRLNGLVLTYNEAGVTSLNTTVYLYYKGISNTTGLLFGTGSVYLYSGKHPAMQPGLQGPYNESNMTYYAAYRSTPITDIVPRNLTINTNTTAYYFELFSSNGTELAYAQIQLLNNFAASSVTLLFFDSEVPLLTLLVPLMAVLSAYQSFGKDRVNGTLSSVVVRPISRIGLISSRFISNTISVFGASAAALGISTLVFNYYLGVYIPAYTLELTLWSLFVITGAFVGLVYLISLLQKSSGQIIGVSLGLFFVLVVFWSVPYPVIPLLISAFVIKAPFGSLAYASSLARLNFLSPAGFISLASSLAGGPTTFGGSYTAIQRGISSFAFLAAGIAWICVPIAISILKFTKSD